MSLEAYIREICKELHSTLLEEMYGVLWSGKATGQRAASASYGRGSQRERLS